MASPWADELGADEVGVRHAERREDVLAQVPVQRLPAHVRHDLPGGRRPVVGVPEPGAGLDAEDQAPPVVLGERRDRPPHRHAHAEVPPECGPPGHLLVDPGGVGQQMAHRRRPPPAIPGNQLVRAQVVVGRGVEVDEPSFSELQNGDRGEGLGDGGDPEDGVLGDRCPGGDVGKAVCGEELQRAVPDHPEGEAHGGPSIEDLVHPPLDGRLMGLAHGVLPRSGSWPRGPAVEWGQRSSPRPPANGGDRPGTGGRTSLPCPRPRPDVAVRPPAPGPSSLSGGPSGDERGFRAPPTEWGRPISREGLRAWRSPWSSRACTA